MRKCFLFVIGVSCIFSSVSRSLYAQSEGVIHGVVTAKADGSTLPDTAIRLESSSLVEPLRTTTGQDGHFTFQRLIPGQYTLVASHSDFQDERIQFTLKPREIQNISLELSLRGIVQSIEVRDNPQSVADTYSPSSTTLQKEAVEAGFYQPPGLADRYPRIQILSIAELLVGKKIEYPRLLDVTYKKAPRARGAVAEAQIPLAGAEVEDEGPF